jgi:hypothetical protein
MKSTFIFALILFCSIPVLSFGQLCGDVNGDGSAGILDALIIARCYTGMVECPDPAVADVDCSGKVDIVDALILAQYYVGLNSGLKCCPPASTVTVGVSAGMQCMPLEYPTLNDAVSFLERNGIHVIASTVIYMTVCAACEVCPDGRVWIALINVADLEKAISLGWGQY